MRRSRGRPRAGWPALPCCVEGRACAASQPAVQGPAVRRCAARASAMRVLAVPVSAAPVAAVRVLAVVVLAAVLLPVAAGCGASGPPRAAVKGRVTLDGQPLAAGAIHFVPVGQTKGPLAAARIVNGEYSLSRAEGPVVGRVRVEIYSPTEAAIPLDDPLAFAAADASAMPQERLPARYNRASNQFVDVKSEGENHFDFQLVSDP